MKKIITMGIILLSIKNQLSAQVLTWNYFVHYDSAGAIYDIVSKSDSGFMIVGQR